MGNGFDDLDVEELRDNLEHLKNLRRVVEKELECLRARKRLKELPRP